MQLAVVALQLHLLGLQLGYLALLPPQLHLLRAGCNLLLSDCLIGVHSAGQVLRRVWRPAGAHRQRHGGEQPPRMGEPRYHAHHACLQPSLSMKILCIDNFTTKLLSKLLSDLYIGVHLKGTRKFGSKVINRQLFYRKIVVRMKKLSITIITNKLVSIKNYFLNGPQ